MKLMLFLSVLLTSFLAQAVENTPADFERIFKQGDQEQQAKIVETMAWAGISHGAFLDSIEQTLLDAYKLRWKPVQTDELSWFAKALGYSGNPKYIPTLQLLSTKAKSQKIKKYALQGLALSEQYNAWNKVINPPQSSSYASSETRFLRMLQSNETQLIKLAAKRIYYTKLYTPEVLAQLSESILLHYKAASTRYEIESIAFMMRSLATAEESQYRSTVQAVASGANSSKLRKYAKKFLRMMQ